MHPKLHHDTLTLEHTTAVILAGGLGTRLRSIVPDKPKVLADVGGQPFIAHLLAQLDGEGVKEVVLCTGHLGAMVEDRLGATYQGMALRYSRETSPLGTGGALRQAYSMIGSDTVLVLNGDSYYDADLATFAAWHTAQASSATLLLAWAEDTCRYGRVDLDESGRVLRFREKTSTAGPGWVNAGVYLLSARVIESIPSGGAVSLEHEVFPALVGGALRGFRGEGRLLDIGIPEAYQEANLAFVGGKRCQRP